MKTSHAANKHRLQNDSIKSPLIPVTAGLRRAVNLIPIQFSSLPFQRLPLQFIPQHSPPPGTLDLLQFRRVFGGFVVGHVSLTCEIYRIVGWLIYGLKFAVVCVCFALEKPGTIRVWGGAGRNVCGMLFVCWACELEMYYFSVNVVQFATVSEVLVKGITPQSSGTINGHEILGWCSDTGCYLCHRRELQKYLFVSFDVL